MNIIYKINAVLRLELLKQKNKLCGLFVKGD